MRKMMIITSDRQADRMQADRAELADRIARALSRDGKIETQPGLHFHRQSAPAQRVHGVSEPSFCVIAQGSKEDDASHFNREYKRQFGEPPMRDVEQLRELAGANAAQSFFPHEQY